jgi:FkbM family methyltransferase
MKTLTYNDLTPSSLNVFAYRVYMKLNGWIRPKRTALTFFGCEFECDIRDLLQKRIYFFKTWEPQLSSFMSECLRSGDVAVDVGGNIGYFTALMSTLVGEEGRVISIEASPSTFNLLQNTLRRNECNNVTAINIAVSDCMGETDLYENPSQGRNLGSMGIVKHPDSERMCTVPCDRFLNIVRDVACQISFIKVDIEGAERPLLEEILANKDLFKKPFTLVAEISLSNRDMISKFAHQGFTCSFLPNDYSFAGYMRSAHRGPSRRQHQLEDIPSRPIGENCGDFVFMLKGAL